MGWAFEEVLDSVGSGIALRAGSRVDEAYPVLVGSEPRAMARSQLRQRHSVVTRERALRGINVRGGGIPRTRFRGASRR